MYTEGSLIDRLSKITDIYERNEMIFDWIKKGQIGLMDFNEILNHLIPGSSIEKSHNQSDEEDYYDEDYDEYDEEVNNSMNTLKEMTELGIQDLEVLESLLKDYKYGMFNSAIKGEDLGKAEDISRQIIALASDLTNEGWGLEDSKLSGKEAEKRDWEASEATVKQARSLIIDAIGSNAGYYFFADSVTENNFDKSLQDSEDGEFWNMLLDAEDLDIETLQDLADFVDIDIEEMSY